MKQQMQARQLEYWPRFKPSTSFYTLHSTPLYQPAQVPWALAAASGWGRGEIIGTSPQKKLREKITIE
jgi:hypothetical protein